MKKLKRFTALFVTLIIMITLLPSVVYAQETAAVSEPATYTDATAAFNETFGILISMLCEDNDKEVTKALCGTAIHLLEVYMGFLRVADDGSDRNLFAEAGPAVFEYHADPEYVDGFDYEAGYDICRENRYIRIESEAFDTESKEQLDYLRFESATREETGELMLLFTLYDINGYLTSSSRYLLYWDGTSTQLLYSRTLGKALAYRIDLNEWAKGTDYTWSKDLLYSAQ